MSDGKTPATPMVKTPSVQLPVWPTPIRRLNQGVRPGHVAWDVDAQLGDPVFAMVGGVVDRMVQNEPSGYGNLLVIRTDAGYRIYYGHNSQFLVEPGARVRPGQVIALAGSTGRSTGPHVHLEVRDPSGRQVDPAAFFGDAFRELRATVGATAAAIAGKRAPGYQLVSATSAVPTGSLKRAAAVSTMPGTRTVAGKTLEGQPAKAASGRTLLQTPLGDVSVPPFEPGAWANVGAVIAGAILGVVGLVMVGKPAVEKAKPIVEKVGSVASKAAILAA